MHGAANRFTLGEQAEGELCKGYSRSLRPGSVASWTPGRRGTGAPYWMFMSSEKSFSSMAFKPTFVDTQIFSPIDIAVMLHPVEME